MHALGVWIFAIITWTRSLYRKMRRRYGIALAGDFMTIFFFYCWMDLPGLHASRLNKEHTHACDIYRVFQSFKH